MSKLIHRLNFGIYADGLFGLHVTYTGRDACECGEITMQIYNGIMLPHGHLCKELWVTTVRAKG